MAAASCWCCPVLRRSPPPEERVHGNAELIGWQQGSDEVSAFFANGDIWSGDLLVAADGIVTRVAPRLVPEHRLHYLGDRVWRGVVADDHFCTDGAFFVYARGRGIYVNAFDLGPGPDGRSRTHWGFFHEEPLPVSREQQRRLLQEPIPAEALTRLDPLPRLVDGRVGLLGGCGPRHEFLPGTRHAVTTATVAVASPQQDQGSAQPRSWPARPSAGSVPVP